MTPEDLSLLRLPSGCRISPDATRYAFVVTNPDITRNLNIREVWVGDEHGARRFTSGDDDFSPRWSPDGARLAFLRSVDGSDKQVAVMPADGGEAKVVTDFTHGVESLEWSPDGKWLVVVAVTPVPDWEGLDDFERSRRPRRIATLPYRYDDRGWTHDRKRHLWLVEPDNPEGPVCLTPGPHDEEHPAWSPDGARIAFIASREENPGLTFGNQIWEVDVETREIKPVTPGGHWAQVSYSPDGSIHMIGSESDDYPVNWCLHRLEPDGSTTNLTGSLDRSSYSFALERSPIGWDGPDAIVGLEDSGSYGLIRVTPGGDVSPEVSGARVVSSFDVATGKIVFAASTTRCPGEVYVTGSGKEVQVTSLNDSDLGLIEPEHHTVESDGNEIDVWLYLPPGTQKVPVLLNIHGGPASQYGFGFFDEFQVYASAGYGIVACNPRGSTGRGLDFTRAVIGDGWGTVDRADIGAAVDSALERSPRLDAERLGVMGGSYGGFLTAWLIGKESRWKSAVVERALLSWNSFAGTSDIGGTFPYSYTRASYPDDWDRWWELSPLSIANDVTTPTLIIHAEDDLRCPIEQAEQYFMALMRNGTVTEFLRFPGEGHEMSRSGSPLHRMERFEAILDWHERHLR